MTDLLLPLWTEQASPDARDRGLRACRNVELPHHLLNAEVHSAFSDTENPSDIS
jgi:hypothetical protein